MKRNVALALRAWRQTRWPENPLPKDHVDATRQTLSADLAMHNGLGLLLREQRRLRRSHPRSCHGRPCTAWERLRRQLDSLNYAAWHAHLAGIRRWMPVGNRRVATVRGSARSP